MRAVKVSLRVSVKCCRSHDDQRAGNFFLKQRISIALQIGNAACVLGTVTDRDALEKILFHIVVRWDWLSSLQLNDQRGLCVFFSCFCSLGLLG